MLPKLPNGYTARVSSGWGKRNVGSYASKDHKGIDCVYTKPSPPTKYPFYCPISGTVTAAGYGKYGIVKIRDDNGFSHEFLHSRKCLVKNGQRISGYTPIAYMSDQGAPGGVHVHYQLREPGGKPINPVDFWNGKPIAFIAAGEPNNKLIHESTDQGYNVTGEPAGTAGTGTLYEYQGRQAGVALPPPDVEYALWTNRVPQHEPWARVMMVDTENLNKSTNEHEFNTSHNPQLLPDNEAGAKLIGRLDGDDEIVRGPFWRK